MKKIVILFSLFLIPLLLNPVYAVNSLQNTSLSGQSATISLDITFGKDTVKQLVTRNVAVSHLGDITLMFYGDEIPLSEPELKVISNGDHFRISSIPEGIIMYGHKDADVGNYKINIYITSDNGLKKFSVSTSTHLEGDKVIETVEEPKEKTPYIPDLMMTSSHDFRTYWKDTFNIDVQAFDGRINSDPKSSDFNGRIDGVDVKVLLSLDGNQVATLSGVTEHGEWKGEYFFKENISTPGEYVVDVILSYLGETVSKSSSMFVIAATTGGDSTNHAPIANAGTDDTTPNGVLISLDGTGSSDPDGDAFTFSWAQLSGPAGPFVDTTTATPDYTPTNTGTAVFELTVTDSKGKSDTDTVSIIVT